MFVKNLPLYFYNYDFDEYTGIRGFDIDYNNELPGITSKNPKDIIKAIDSGNYDFVKLNKFRNKYVKKTKGATKDLVDLLFKIML